MLLLETVPNGDETLFCVTPVVDGKPSEDTEYVFLNEEDQAEFVEFFFHNQVAAHFAYYASMEARHG